MSSLSRGESIGSTARRLLRRSLRRLVDATLVELVNYVDSRRAKPRQSVINLIELQALTESASYAEQKMAAALYFRARENLWLYAISQARVDGLYAEFGVYRGYSINFFARRLQHKTLYGFDSFEGLKEDWTGHTMTKGHFDLHGQLPKVEHNVQLIKGWFDDSVPRFLAEHDQPFALVHMDADTYEATATVLDLLASRVKPGLVIIFDQYFGYRGWKLGEWKAWQEFCQSRGIGYRYLGFASAQVAVIVE